MVQAGSSQWKSGKIEQIYSQLQTKVKNKPDEKMITLDKHLAMLVKADKVELKEAQKWVNHISSFVDAMKHD
jgi:Tfp pilus assembly pilus retraction ATPase PilT